MSELGMQAVAAERARYAAMLAGDVAALEAMLDAAFIYTHSTGFTEGKEPYLARIRDGIATYPEARIIEISAAVHGETVLLSGRVQMAADLPREGRRIDMDNLFLSVWVSKPDGLLLAAYAATRLPGERS